MPNQSNRITRPAWIEIERTASPQHPHEWIPVRKVCDVEVGVPGALEIDRHELVEAALDAEAPRARLVVDTEVGKIPIMYADRPTGPWPTE
jgi:hypothetical protein